MTELNRIVTWQTPFSSVSFPSVTFSAGDSTSEYVLRVLAGKLYEVRCLGVVSIRFTEESFFPPDRFYEAQNEPTSSTYLIKNSTWVREFDSSAESIAISFGSDSMIHYVICGGDYHVEFLATKPPEIIEVT